MTMALPRPSEKPDPFVDAHVEILPLAEPFYPGPAGKWTGNDITNPDDPQYKDQLWDLK